MEEKLGFYKPEIIKEDPLALDPQAIAYAPKLAGAAKNGMIPVTLEEDVVIQRISHDLYANASSGFRELFNNEARACRIARKKYGANPKIVITVVPSKRSLSIQGFDSMGMSQDRFLQIFTRLGRSDNFDGSEIGQFGFGRAAYTTLSEIMILKTWARETNERYAVMGKNGIGYNVLPEPELESYGTRVELTLYGKVSLEKIINTAVDCARFCDVDTFLDLEEDTEWDSSNIPKNAGRHKIGPTTFQEYYEQITSRIIEFEGDRFRGKIPVIIHDEDFDLYGMYIFRNPWASDDVVLASHSPVHRSQDLCLLGTPIEGSIWTNFTYVLINVKNERKYRPTPDRERFAQESIDALQKKIDEKIKEAVSFLNLKTTDDYIKSDRKAVYKRFRDDGFAAYLDDRTEKIARLINTEIITKEKPTHKLVHEILDECSKPVYMEKLDGSKIAAIRNAIPNAVCFRLEDPSEENHQMLRDHGVIFGDDYIRKHKIKVQRIEKEITEIVIHGAREGFAGNSTRPVQYTQRIQIADMPENVIRVGDDFKQATELLSSVLTGYKIVKDSQKIDGGIGYEEFLAELENKQYATSDGPQTLKEISRSTKEIYLAVYPNTDVLRYLKDQKTIVITSNEDEIFEIMLYLKNKSKAFTFNTTGKSIWGDSGRKGIFERFSLHRLNDYEFTVDRYANSVDDPQILMGIVHAVKRVKNKKLLEIFLNAARHTRNKEYNSKLLEDVFSIDDSLPS
jgi:hypothetical protein